MTNLEPNGLDENLEKLLDIDTGKLSTQANLSATSLSSGGIEGLLLIKKNGKIVVNNGDEDIFTLGIQEDGTIGIDMADGKIESAWIVGKSITADQIASGTITTDEIAANTIEAGDIKAGTITTTQIAANTIEAGDIKAGTITATEIKDSTLTNAKIVDSTIESGKIKNATITGAKIASTTIENANIKDATITYGKIASVNASTISTGTLSADRIAAGSINATKITSNSITGTQITTGCLELVDLYASTGVAIGGAPRCVSGLDVVGTKNWTMDHPLIEEKTLRHSCLEGPEAADFYRGTVTLVDGKATVQLRDYFDIIHIKEGRQVFLTCPIPMAYVASFKKNTIKIEVPEDIWDQYKGYGLCDVQWLVIATRDIPFEEVSDSEIWVEEEKKNMKVFKLRKKGKYWDKREKKILPIKN